MRFNIPFCFLFIRCATSFYIRGSCDSLPENEKVGEFIRCINGTKNIELVEDINKKYLK